MIRSDASGLGDAFELAFAAQIGFELSEYTEHVEETFACGDAGIDRLFGRSQRGAAGLHLAHDILQIANAAGEASILDRRSRRQAHSISRRIAAEPKSRQGWLHVRCWPSCTVGGVRLERKLSGDKLLSTPMVHHRRI